MLDFTNQIKLTPHYQQKYKLARYTLLVIYVISALYIADKVLFPEQTKDYSFSSINSLKNTIPAPTIISQGNIAPAKSVVPVGQKFAFFANPLGNFSDISVTYASNSTAVQNTSVTIHKSYQAFFYPEGQPMGFKNGSLLTADGSYYIVSGGLLRKFAGTDIILKFGFPKDAFVQIGAADLKNNPAGPDIQDSVTYPDDTLFRVDNNFYQLKNQQLMAFVSQRAFDSQYEEIQAISKTDDLLNQFPLSETAVGFADGTLASSDQSVFILSRGKSYPIENVDTFLAMGYDFKNVIALDSEELGLYERQKQFTDDQPHPDGTMFLDQKTNKFFIIENQAKRPITSSAVLKTYGKQIPIIANSQSFDTNISCQLHKQPFSNNYTCNAPLAALLTLPGNSYQISASFGTEIKLSELHSTFSTPINWLNLRDSISSIKEKIKTNYLGQSQ